MESLKITVTYNYKGKLVTREYIDMEDAYTVVLLTDCKNVMIEGIGVFTPTEFKNHYEKNL